MAVTVAKASTDGQSGRFRNEALDGNPNLRLLRSALGALGFYASIYWPSRSMGGQLNNPIPYRVRFDQTKKEWGVIERAERAGRV